MEKVVFCLYVLEVYLQQYDYLEGGYGIVDIYLVVVFNWVFYVGVDFGVWLVVKVYY